MATRPLTPSENHWFTSQGNRARQAFDLGTQQNRYERRLANDQYGWQKADLAQQFQRQRERFATGYGRRGMLSSGNYQQNLQRFIGDYNTQVQRAALGNRWKNDGYDIANDQLARVRDDALAELQAQKKAYQDTIASVVSAYT